MPRIQDIGVFNAVREAGTAKLLPPIPRITVGMGLAAAATERKSFFTPFRMPLGAAGKRFCWPGWDVSEHVFRSRW